MCFILQLLLLQTLCLTLCPTSVCLVSPSIATRRSRQVNLDVDAGHLSQPGPGRMLLVKRHKARNNRRKKCASSGDPEAAATSQGGMDDPPTTAQVQGTAQSDLPGDPSTETPSVVTGSHPHAQRHEAAAAVVHEHERNYAKDRGQYVRGDLASVASAQLLLHDYQSLRLEQDFKNLHVEYPSY